MLRYCLVILGLSLLLLSCSGGEDEGGVLLPTIPVKTEMVEKGAIEIKREFTGGLVGMEQADIYIRLSEAVTALPYDEGGFVEKNAVIIELDKGGASSRYFQAEAAFENAKKSFEKMERLFNEGAVSEIEFDNVEAAFRVARADYTAARELVQITAPISGQLVDLDVKVGDVPAVGTLAARIARTDRLRLSFGVPTELIGSFRTGMTGEMMVSSLADTFVCTVTEVARAADPATRTFTVETTVPNGDGRLQAGMFAKVVFVVDQKSDVVTVNRNALLSTEGIYEVFVVANDTAYTRSVTVGLVNDVHSEIVTGLQPGEEVVVLGQSFLSDGYPILRSQDN